MRKLVICCDMDDTIEYLMKAWTNWLNKRYDLEMSYEDVSEWDLLKAFSPLTWDQISEPLFIPEFWDTVEPMQDAIEVLPRLIAQGHTIYICTSTDYRIAKEKFDRCLFKHFPFIDRHQLILTYNKQMIDCDILVDDATHNIVGKYVGLLMDAPHNRTFRVYDHEKVFRVYNWYDIEQLITSYSRIE